MLSAVIDFPHPDSPTTPSTSPGAQLRTRRPPRPSRRRAAVGKYVCRSRTSRRGSAAALIPGRTGSSSADGCSASWYTVLSATTAFVARYGGSAVPAFGRKFGKLLEATATRTRWPARKRWATGRHLDRERRRSRPARAARSSPAPAVPRRAARPGARSPSTRSGGRPRACDEVGVDRGRGGMELDPRVADDLRHRRSSTSRRVGQRSAPRPRAGRAARTATSR